MTLVKFVDVEIELSETGNIESKIDIEFDSERRNFARGQYKTSLANMAESLMNQSSKEFLTNLNVSGKVSQVLTFGEDVNQNKAITNQRLPRFTLLHYSPVKAAWDWLILILVIYTAIFTPYVTAFLLNDHDSPTYVQGFASTETLNELNRNKIIEHQTVLTDSLEHSLIKRLAVIL